RLCTAAPAVSPSFLSPPSEPPKGRPYDAFPFLFSPFPDCGAPEEPRSRTVRSLSADSHFTGAAAHGHTQLHDLFYLLHSHFSILLRIKSVRIGRQEFFHAVRVSDT